MKNEKIQVDRVSREVIEGKLLASLADDAKVAIVCSEVELSILIEALEVSADAGSSSAGAGVGIDDVQMLKDLRKLRKEAFGK